MTAKQAERIEKALYQLQAYKYRIESSYTLNDAQRNLSGRTHYVDNETLKYFGARIVRAWMPERSTENHGFTYAIVESLRKPGEKNTKRAVLFDCFGEVVFQSEFEKTPDKAEKALYAFLDSFDLKAHYIEKIRAIANRKQQEAKRALQALSGKLKA